MYCQQCGAQVADDARFCHVCGAQQMPVTAAPEPRQTPYAPPRSTSARTSYQPAGQSTSVRTGPMPPAGAPSGGKSNTAVIIAVILGVLLAAALGYLAYEHFVKKPEEKTDSLTFVQAVPTQAPESNGESGGIFTRSTEKPERTEKPDRTPKPEDTPEPTSEPTPEPTAEPTPKPTPEPEPEPEVISRRDPDPYKTEEDPTLGDFLWVDQDIYRGSLPSGRETLTELYEASGGWKVYMIDDPDSGTNMERLCTAHVGTSDGQPAMVLHSGYAHDGSTDEGWMEEPNDSLFTGDWLDGGMDLVGAGRITIDEFYWLDGREYGVGTFMWPDGVTASLFLSRP